MIADVPTGSSVGVGNRGGVVLTTALLLVVIGLAWWQTVADAHGMSGMLAGLAQAGRAMVLDAGLARFVVMWTVMMAAMMLAGIIPVIVAGPVSNPLTGATMATGYLAVWSSTAVPVYAALTALNEVSAAGASLDRIGGTVIALAGAYQFSGWKRRWLEGYSRPWREWRSSRRGQIPSAAGGLRVGLSDGLRCVAGSWALMSVLVVVGVMNLWWMGAIGAACLAEKTSSRRTALAIGIGVALVVLGLATVIEPRMITVIA